MTDVDPGLSTEQAHAIALEAYLYLYPLVTMELTRLQLCCSEPAGRAGHGPMGTFVHVRSFPDASFREVVRPNFDTLYSTAWVDVSAEPVVVSAPASPDRFYQLPCVDMWTDVFASPGTRTNGPDAVQFALCDPGWSGALPRGVQRIDAPTPTVWIIGRTQTNGSSDYPAVHAVQDQLAITPLSSWGGTAPEPELIVDPAVDGTTPPLQQVNSMAAADFFSLGCQLMAQQSTHLTDWSQIARMARLGLTPGAIVEPDALADHVRDALEAAPAAAQQSIMAQLPRLGPVVDGWMSLVDSMGVYGNFYLKRAVVAMVGLGANQAEDAVYPILQTDLDGDPLDGSRRYVLHFDADRLPPVEAFWSVTMYDGEGYQVANELDRFAIGDRDQLSYNEDGSLDLYLQPDRPEPDRVANWLPSVPGPIGVTMRLYEPRPSVLHGEWTPPPVRKAN